MLNVAKINHTYHLKSVFKLFNSQMNQRYILLNLWELSFCRPELDRILSLDIKDQGQMIDFLFCWDFLLLSFYILDILFLVTRWLWISMGKWKSLENIDKSMQFLLNNLKILLSAPITNAIAIISYKAISNVLR